ncbi:unnamed protein product, partial [Symbiodinium sp. CCMP2592]
RPGPWASPLQWLKHVLSRDFPDISDATLIKLAGDRLQWKNMASQVTALDEDTVHVVYET